MRSILLAFAFSLALASSVAAQQLQIGGQIGFASNRDGNWEIYTMNPAGIGQTTR